MRHYLKYMACKFRDEPWEQLFFNILAGYRGTGISIYSYYLVMEGLFGDPPRAPKTASPIEIRFLGPEDMAQIAAMPERDVREPVMQKRLQAGNKCLGVLDGRNVVAFTWCNLEHCHFTEHPFPLAKDEAYLFDAHTSKKYRGTGIAPYLRYRLYEELAKTGRTKLYSITMQPNKPSLRFKSKLNARIVGKGLSVVLFKRWRVVSKFSPV